MFSRPVANYPFLRRALPLVREDLSVTYTRSLQRWLVVSPLIGVTAGLLMTGFVVVTLHKVWPVVFGFYLRHHWAILPGAAAGFAFTGFLMQRLVTFPDRHSTEEVIESYHLHEGAIDMRSFPVKLLAAVTTVGAGGDAGLEGPSIYGGAAIGSWLWSHLRWIKRLHLGERDRRIMLICGAAAGMSAVFRAPLTGIVFALEMPYKDDLAHEALLPSLIASVVSYLTLTALLGAEQLFKFQSSYAYNLHDLLWCALLGLCIGILSMTFVITFRRLRTFVVHRPEPLWLKLTVGGALVALCALLFLLLYPGTLVPLGPNYEAVSFILSGTHSTTELLTFSVLKLIGTILTLASGGVAAMFMSVFLTGGALGVAFSQALVHSPSPELYAVVGMASFIASAYKTPLAAVVFVAETTGGHGFLIPALVGAAVAYAISGDSSVSSDQRLQEERTVEVAGPGPEAADAAPSLAEPPAAAMKQ